MSTTFGVLKPGEKIRDPEDWEELEEKTIPVAHRSGAGKGQLSIAWLNPLAPLLPPETKVLPLDNTAQGVFTIRDLLQIEKPENPHACFGRKPHPMDFENQEEYQIRLSRWKNWEEEIKSRHE